MSDTPRDPPPPRIGLREGARSLLGGLRFIATHPPQWPLALVPVGVVLALTSTIGGLSVWYIARSSHRLFYSLAGHWGGEALRVLFVVLASVVAVLISAVVSMGLAQPLSGNALETLARRQDASLGGRVWPELPFWPGVWRSLRVNLASLAVGLPLLAIFSLVEVLVPWLAVVTVPLKFLVTSAMLAWDLLDYPLSIRGMRVRERVAWMKRHARACLGFGMASAAVMLVPGLGLLVLPAGACGAARLVHRGETLESPQGSPA